MKPSVVDSRRNFSPKQASYHRSLVPGVRYSKQIRTVMPSRIVVQLSQYSIERLRDDAEVILCRAHAKQIECSSVLLLAPASTRPSREALKNIDYEYSLRSELDSAWPVRPVALSEQAAPMALVLEHPGGQTLDGFLSGTMKTMQLLDIAVGLATALRGLHGNKLIHRDLKPTKLLVDSATGQVRLMGFGIALRLPREHQSPDPPEFFAGTLHYMAPEQTGRMNRSVNSRSDLYAVGLTLYEMLTGNLPFAASNPLECIHCHMARHPAPPHDRVKSVPPSISTIVANLPEERYQTVSGVESDLRRCLAVWVAYGRIANFLPGQRDAPDRLLILEKLYGRARENETLLTVFDRVAAGGRPELVLVSGYSGIGNSAVVSGLHKPRVPALPQQGGQAPVPLGRSGSGHSAHGLVLGSPAFRRRALVPIVSSFMGS